MNNVKYVEMAEQEKNQNHPGGLSDKADEADPKMFLTGETHLSVQNLKKLIRVLNPGEEPLFQRPKRRLGNMIKEISVVAKLSEIYTNHCIRATSVTLLDNAVVGSQK